jgi:hypothetical protein
MKKFQLLLALLALAAAGWDATAASRRGLALSTGEARQFIWQAAIWAAFFAILSILIIFRGD